MPEVQIGDTLSNSNSEGSGQEQRSVEATPEVRLEKSLDNKANTEERSASREQAAATYFQSQMRNLADTLKESMGNMITNAKGDRLSAAKLGDQMLAAAVLRQERNYEMP